MAAELWCRISSAAPRNAVRWATEISWISTRGFTGVRVGIGFSDTDPDGIAYDPSGINLTHLNTILDMLVMCKLKCQLEIGGEGPPNIYDWYNGVGGYGSAWPYGKRPPLGPGNAIVDLTALFRLLLRSMRIGRGRCKQCHRSYRENSSNVAT